MKDTSYPIQSEAEALIIITPEDLEQIVVPQFAVEQMAYVFLKEMESVLESQVCDLDRESKNACLPDIDSDTKIEPQEDK